MTTDIEIETREFSCEQWQCIVDSLIAPARPMLPEIIHLGLRACARNRISSLVLAFDSLEAHYVDAAVIRLKESHEWLTLRCT